MTEIGIKRFKPSIIASIFMNLERLMGIKKLKRIRIQKIVPEYMKLAFINNNSKKNVEYNKLV